MKTPLVLLSMAALLVVTQSLVSCDNERGSHSGSNSGEGALLIGCWANYVVDEEEGYYGSNKIIYFANGSYKECNVTMNDGYRISTDSGRWVYNDSKLVVYSLKSYCVEDGEVLYDRGVAEPWITDAIVKDNTLLINYEDGDEDNWMAYTKRVTNSNGIGVISGHEYVDLGLSVMWATCNIGASKPEEYGNYYAWGESRSKSNYSWSSYDYCNGSSSTLTKYCSNRNYGYNGYTDYYNFLVPEDDVAHDSWSGCWRIPTFWEISELCSECSWTWMTRNGVKGYEVTSNVPGYEGRSIFLPAAGYCNGTSKNDVGVIGGYWSNSLYKSDPRRAFMLEMGQDSDEDIYERDISYRYYGLSVRPVCP